MLKLIDIIKNSRILNNLSPELPGDDFPGGGGSGGGGSTTPSGGGTGGSGSGTTSSNLIPSLTLSPSDNQSIVVGTTLCLTAEGVLSLPQESETFANLSIGCAPVVQGNYFKTCGSNGNYDAEASDPNLIYSKRSFQFTGNNFFLNSPGPPIKNCHLLLGIKSTGGYQFIWEVYNYCGTAQHGCNDAWICSIKIIYPNGSVTTLHTGEVEFRQYFRIRSDGQTIYWDFTTHNKWVYGYQYASIPIDCGDFQPIVNALWLNNGWAFLSLSKGSYQGVINPFDYNWTSECDNNLIVTGNKACYTPTSSGNCKVCVSVLNSETKCVSINASPLTLKPIGKTCKSCGYDTDINCDNIPDPSLPVVILSSPNNISILVSFNKSTSLTNGLYYEIKINNITKTALENDVTINSLNPGGSYTISVRSIDACGSSAWSSPQSITLAQ